MAYVLPFDKFLTKITDADAKKQLSAVRLPDVAFFGEDAFKPGTKSISISAKTTPANVKYLSSRFKVQPVGKNLDILFANSKIRFVESGKQSTASTRNALGKKLADAGELATMVSLVREIETPEDTGQDIFIDDLNAFSDWLPTFQHTKTAVYRMIKHDISSYEILHDATDRSDFKQVLSAFLKKTKMVKDSWNPADIFLIKKVEFKNVVSELNHIVDNFDVADGLIDMFNSRMYSFYQQGVMYPISLKKLASSSPTVELNNVPGASASKYYHIQINKFNCDLSLKGREIGGFSFANKDTGKIISMQVRGFPHGYGIAQTEITSDGSPSGGRLGKVSANVIDRIMAEYKAERITSIRFFGSLPNAFGEFDSEKIETVWSWYKQVTSSKHVLTSKKLTKDEFTSLIATARSDFTAAATVCMKIQGLKMMQFFIDNEKDVSDIMNKMIAGAKKQSAEGGFFIKIS